MQRASLIAGLIGSLLGIMATVGGAWLFLASEWAKWEEIKKAYGAPQRGNSVDLSEFIKSGAIVSLRSELNVQEGQGDFFLSSTEQGSGRDDGNPEVALTKHRDKPLMLWTIAVER